MTGGPYGPPFFMSIRKPLILATNDDGIQSKFLLAMVKELVGFAEVVVCAPDGERSWIGHAISRHQKLIPEEEKDFPTLAYSLNGTPADCVNLACGNLLPHPPDLVMSGINLGYNVTLPMILSSGTVGAALEGSLLGHKSLAVSMALPNDEFEEIRKSCGSIVSDGVKKSLLGAAQASARYAKLMLELSKPPGLVVHNLNFPNDYNGEDPMISFAGSLHIGSLFERAKGRKYHQLVYRPEWLENAKPEIGSDLWALNEGMASASRLDFAQLSGKSYLEP